MHSEAIGATRGSSLGRQFFAVAVMSCALASWAIAAAGLSAALVGVAPRVAATFNPKSAETRLALAQLSEKSLLAGAPGAPLDRDASAATREVGLAALRAAPLSATAFRQLSRAAQQAGDSKLASVYLNESFRRFFRQPDVAAQLFLESIGQSDMPRTVMLLDALLRADASRLQAAFSLMASIARSDELRPMLVNRLAAKPAWRRDFLEMLGKSEADEPSMLKLFTALNATNAPMTRMETIWFGFELAKREHTDAALGLWYAYLPPAAVADLPLLYNGDFSLPTDDSPFNWVIEQPPNAMLKIVDIENDEKALGIEFTGRRGEFAPAYQHTALVPGNYRLTGRLRADDFRNPEGLVWTIYCGWAKRSKIGQTERLFDTAGVWRTFTLDFNVPASDCSEQHLRLELPAATEARQLATGSVRFSRMAIARK